MVAIHRGHMSKHPAIVKIAILEFLEARLKDIIAPGKDSESIARADRIVKVYDPFTTENDFYLFLDLNWEQYKQLYGEYYDTERPKGWRQQAVEEYYEDYEYDEDSEINAKWVSLVMEALHGTQPSEGVFNASRSSSEILYTVAEMRQILKIPREEE